MRNPLSAIMLSADGIASSIVDFRAPHENPGPAYRELLENNLDAAQTIVLCAQHQKRIIDDVLTLSKLNSALLQVTPVSVQVSKKAHFQPGSGRCKMEGDLTSHKGRGYCPQNLEDVRERAACRQDPDLIHCRTFLP